MAWLTPAELRNQWSQAPANDAVAQKLLDAGKKHVLALGPELADETDPPSEYTLAQGMVARKIWEQQRVNVASDDELGTEAFTYRLGSSLRYAILDLLRPPRPPIGIG